MEHIADAIDTLDALLVSLDHVDMDEVQAQVAFARDELREHAVALHGWLQHAEATGDGAVPDAEAVDATALQRIAARFDPDFGGSRGAPKFPRATELEWLLDGREEADAAGMAKLALANMASRVSAASIAVVSNSHSATRT